MATLSFSTHVNLLQACERRWECSEEGEVLVVSRLRLRRERSHHRCHSRGGATNPRIGSRRGRRARGPGGAGRENGWRRRLRRRQRSAAPGPGRTKCTAIPARAEPGPGPALVEERRRLKFRSLLPRAKGGSAAGAGSWGSPGSRLALGAGRLLCFRWQWRQSGQRTSPCSTRAGRPG